MTERAGNRRHVPVNQVDRRQAGCRPDVSVDFRDVVAGVRFADSSPRSRHSHRASPMRQAYDPAIAVPSFALLNKCAIMLDSVLPSSLESWPQLGGVLQLRPCYRSK